MACTVQAKKANRVTSAGALREANIMGVLAENKTVVMKVKVGIDKARQDYSQKRWVKKYYKL
jgi:hypothetical protein